MTKKQTDDLLKKLAYVEGFVLGHYICACLDVEPVDEWIRRRVRNGSFYVQYGLPKCKQCGKEMIFKAAK